MFIVHCGSIVLLLVGAVLCQAEGNEGNFTELTRTTRTPAVVFIDLYTLQTGADYREITTKQRPSPATTSPTQRPKRQGPSSRFLGGSPEFADVEQRLAGIFRSSSAAAKGSPEGRFLVPGMKEKVLDDVPGQDGGEDTGTMAGESTSTTDRQEASPGEVFPGKEVTSRGTTPGEVVSVWIVSGEIVPGEFHPGEMFPGEALPKIAVPEGNFAGDAIPEENRSSGNVLGHAESAATVPGENKSFLLAPGEALFNLDKATGETPGGPFAPVKYTPAYTPPEVLLSSTFAPGAPETRSSTAPKVPGVPVTSPPLRKPTKPTFDEVDALFLPDINVVTTILPNQTWFHKIFDFSDVFQRINRNPRTFNKVSLPGEVSVPTPGEAALQTSGEVPAPTLGEVPAPAIGEVPAPTIGEVPAPTIGEVPAPTPGEVPAPAPGELSQIMTATTVAQLTGETTILLDLSDYDYDPVDSNTTLESEMKNETRIPPTSDNIGLFHEDLATTTEDTVVHETLNVVTTTSKGSQKEIGSTVSSRTSQKNTVPFFADSPTLRFFQENCAAIVGGIVGLVLVVVGCYVVCQRRLRSGRMNVCRATVDWQISDMKPRRQPLIFSPTMETPLTTVEVIPDCASPECLVQPRRLATFIPTPPPVPKFH